MGQRLARTPLFGEWRSGNLVFADIEKTTGRYFFVHSGTGTDEGGAGYSPDQPLATIDYAIGLATASVGDVIIVMPGHAESLAAAGAFDCDKIGLTIKGLGVGSNRPTITFTHVDADVDIDAAGITISGLRFVGGIDNHKIMIDVNAAYFEMTDCEFVTGTATICYNFINLATTVDNFIFRRCVFRQPVDPDGTNHADDTGCFYLEDSENILIEDCEFYGEFESSIFHNKTTLCANLWIRNCFGEQALAGADVATIVVASTGGMHDCAWNVPDAADNTTIASFITMAQDTFFGFHDVTFMNDNAAGEWAASVVNTAST